MAFHLRVSIPSSSGQFCYSFGGADTVNHVRQKVGAVNTDTFLILGISWTSLLGDSPLGYKPQLTILHFIKKFVEDPLGLIRALSELGHRLISTPVRGSDGVTIKPFLSEFKATPVFKEYLEFYRTDDPALLKYLLTFLFFGKKTSYKDASLDATALRRWVEVEERLARLTVEQGTLVNLREIMRWLFDDWSPGAFLPKHGSGSVSEPGVHGVRVKNQSFAVSAMVRWTYLRDTIMLPNETGVFGLPQGGSWIEGAVIDFARLMFVAKDFKSSRSICMEPIGQQWSQQGLRLWLETYMSWHTVFRCHIDIKKQVLSQMWSLYGSLTGLIDTIDLSSASDSVAWSLIKAIMPAKILRHFMATRTRRVLTPDGTIWNLSKFAPMGSAVCFPAQCVLYTAITLMVAFSQSLAQSWTDPNMLKGVDLSMLYSYSFSDRLTKSDSMNRFLPFRIYGDDISLDKRLTSNLMSALGQLGFEVNTSKSFTGSQIFRESCGAFHYKGVDVTPLMFKIKGLVRRMRTEAMAGVLDLANRARAWGYVHLRRHMIRLALHAPVCGRGEGVNPVMFTTDPDDAFAVLCDKPRNTHLRRRRYSSFLSDLVGYKPAGLGLAMSTCIAYQRDEVERLVARPAEKTNLEEDEYFYTVWWRSRYAGGELASDGQPGRTDSRGIGMGMAWSAIP